MKSKLIQQIRKQFRREWLLIRVEEINPDTQEPLKGSLLAHSPRREEVHDEMLRRKGLALITFSEDTLPAGYATAFLTRAS